MVAQTAGLCDPFVASRAARTLTAKIENIQNVVDSLRAHTLLLCRAS
jgi:hypothetical protein